MYSRMKNWPAFQNEMGQSGIALLQQLTEAGHAAYFVGGCVRDALLGRGVKDLDIATSAKPEEVMALFPEAVPTGLQHGTVTVPSRGWNFEITTFRAESGYSDGRHPDRVEFLNDIQGDLERRDFTINAMALGLDGKLVDPFGGQEDLARKVLRAVGQPEERFQEDALRMLRCVRFAAEYSLTIDERTWEEVRIGAPGLKRIAMERVFAELKRMIEGADPYRSLALLAESGLLRWCKARLRLPNALGIMFSKEDPLHRLGDIQDPFARWIGWFTRMELSAEEAEAVCEALRTPKSFRDRIARGILFHSGLKDVPSEVQRRAWTERVLRYGKDSALSWLQCAPLFSSTAEEKQYEAYVKHGETWLEQMAVFDVKDLEIRGNIILSATGRKGGPWLSALLSRLLLETALGELENEHDALLERVKELLTLGEGQGTTE